MLKKDDVTQSYTGLPPHGGSGLKSSYAILEHHKEKRLPPHGGSGLKYIRHCINAALLGVSLHMEGVD